LKVELYLSHKNMEFNASIVNSKIKWYELAIYTIEENNGNFSKVYLHLNDFVTIQDKEFKESYAIVKGIFRHKGNNKNDYAFIVVDWFENTEKEHSLLKCPLYQLQTKIGD
ncbi:2946_t:CDS:1, partial [Funneliformis geosporum]